MFSALVETVTSHLKSQPMDGVLTPHGIEAEHAAVMLVETTRGENHCGPCIDLTIFAPLDTEFYLVPIQNVSIQLSSSVVALMTYPTHASTMLTYTSLLDDTLSVVDPTLISLRTTTLLI